MSRMTPITGDQLTNALRALDVNFIRGGQITGESLHKQPARLITALAESDESRLRLSLIPLFLEHPQFARHVRPAAKKLKPPARLTLLCYYSAAVWLAQKYRVRNGSLPDYFSEELNLHIGSDPEENLRELAKRHRTFKRHEGQLAGDVPARCTGVAKGSDKRRIYIGQFGNLNVYVADPYSIALSKVDRGFDTDIDDIIFLIEHNYVILDELERITIEALSQARKFDFHPEIREHLQELIARLK